MLDQDSGQVWPGLVDCHTHLDNGRIWPRAESPDGTFAATPHALRLEALLGGAADFRLPAGRR